MSSTGKNLRVLPKFADGVSFLHVEHAVVEQQHGSVALVRGGESVAIPVAALGVLMLGPGTTVSHAAVKNLADHGCSVVWVGEGCARFYAGGLGETRGSERLMAQAQAWANPQQHMEVVVRLYQLRFGAKVPPGLSLRQIRGLEGARVRDTYARWSRETGVPWAGRRYERGNWTAADAVNRAMSAGSAVLYGICHAGIVSMGYSPALGFIHTGKMLSFVYDVADLYKADLLIPAAFRTVAEGTEGVESRIRREIRERGRELRLLERVAKNLLELFEGLGVAGHVGAVEGDLFLDDGARPGQLWDPEGQAKGGTNYGDDRAGEGP